MVKNLIKFSQADRCQLDTTRRKARPGYFIIRAHRWWTRHARRNRRRAGGCVRDLGLL